MQTWGAWAKSWGNSWGNSWGRIEDQATVIGGGGKARGGKYNDPLVDQVLDKWAYIEEAQKRQEPPLTLIDEGKTAAPADVPEASFGDMPQAYSGPPVSLQLPASMLAKPLPAAPKPLLPDYEMLVREAIERDDEEALILILSQL
jgi:hypothetical protein